MLEKNFRHMRAAESDVQFLSVISGVIGIVGGLIPLISGTELFDEKLPNDMRVQLLQKLFATNITSRKS